jgi:hypothetical protein
MLSMDYIKQVLRTSLGDPVDMADLLQLGMSNDQRRIMREVGKATGRLDYRSDESGDVRRAVLFAALWRTIRVTDNQAIILAPTSKKRIEAMSYFNLLVNQNSALVAVTSFPHWYRMEIAKRENWGVFAPTALPSSCAGLHGRGYTIVALDEGKDNLAYCEGIKQAERIGETENLFVQLWNV